MNSNGDGIGDFTGPMLVQTNIPANKQLRALNVLCKDHRLLRIEQRTNMLAGW